MKSILVSTSFCAVMIATGTAFAASDAAQESIASGTTATPLALPSVITDSGKDFLHRCDDAAFARSGNPKGLANRCEKLLISWHREANFRTLAGSSHAVNGIDPPNWGVSHTRGGVPIPNYSQPTPSESPRDAR